MLKVFDPTDDDVSAVFRSDDTVLEYLVVKPKDVSPASLQGLLEKVQTGLPRFGTAKVAVGSTVNLEAQEIGLLSLYASDAVSFSRLIYLRPWGYLISSIYTVLFEEAMTDMTACVCVLDAVYLLTR